MAEFDIYDKSGKKVGSVGEREDPVAGLIDNFSTLFVIVGILCVAMSAAAMYMCFDPDGPGEMRTAMFPMFISLGCCVVINIFRGNYDRFWVCFWKMAFWASVVSGVVNGIGAWFSWRGEIWELPLNCLVMFLYEFFCVAAIPAFVATVILKLVNAIIS